MLSIKFIENFVEMYAFYAYIILFIGVIMEGEVVVILSGIFSHLGSLNLFTSFFVIIVAGFVKSLIGYQIGSHLAARHSHRPFVHTIGKKIDYFLPNFSEKPFWSIFISRFFILGLNWFTLIHSGYKGISKKLYFKAESLSLIVWSLLMTSLGYFFSVTALSVSRDFRKFVVIIFLCFLGFFLIEKIIALAIEIVGDIYDSRGKQKLEDK